MQNLDNIDKRPVKDLVIGAIEAKYKGTMDMNKAVDLLFDLKVEEIGNPAVLGSGFAIAGTKAHPSCHPCADRLMALFGKENTVVIKQAEDKVAAPINFGKQLSNQVSQDIEATYTDNSIGFIHQVKFGTHSFTILVRFGRVEILQAFANEDSLYAYMQRKQIWEYVEKNNIISVLKNMTSEDFVERAKAQYDILPPAPDSEDERGEFTYLEANLTDEENANYELLSPEEKIALKSSARVEDYDYAITIGWKRAELRDGLQQIIKDKVRENAEIFQYHIDPINGIGLSEDK